jgi:Transposase, Mutator family
VASPRSSAWHPAPPSPPTPWHGFLADLTERGLASPLLVVSDGNPDLVGAIEQVFPKALRQRCLIHRAMPGLIIGLRHQ